MALSFQQYLGNGSNRDFVITFGYLARSHISVSINGVPTTAFSFTSATVLRLDTAPVINAIVELRRSTPKTEALVDFQDGSTLTETDLDTSTLQVFYIAQEAFDMAGGTLSLMSDGSYSALTRRIGQVGDPINDTDVVTKRWVIADVNSNVAEARAARDAAIIAKTDTQTAQANTYTARDNTYTARDIVLAAVAQAETAKTVSTANKDQTALDKAATAADRVQTGLDRVAAAASAAAAAQSATDAALFDPSSYFTKTETDARFFTQTQITTNYYSKTQVDAALATRDTTIAGKFDKTGGTITGDIQLNGTANYIRLFDTDQNQTRSIHHNTGYIGFLGSSGGWAMRVDDTGALWTSQLGDLNARIEARALAYANDRVANLSFRKVSPGSFSIPDNGLQMCPAGAVFTGMNMAGTQNNPTMYYHYLQAYDPVRGWVTFGGS
jgi:hypothetical protein